MFLGGVLSLLSVVIAIPAEFNLNSKVLGLAVGSGICEGLYLFSLAKTFKKSSLGVSYAIMRGGAMILVWLVSLNFLSEAANPVEYLGAILILVGILAMNLQNLGFTQKLNWNPWPFLGAIFIAGYHIFYHQSLEHGAEPRSLFTISVFVSLPLVFAGISSNRLERIKTTVRSEPLSVIATAVLSAFSFLIFLYGLRVSAPGFAISLRNSSIFFALIFSFFMKENLSRAQVMGALVIAAGAIMLSLSSCSAFR